MSNRGFRGRFTYEVHVALSNTSPAIEQVQEWAEGQGIRFETRDWDEGHFLLFSFRNEADADAVEQEFKRLIEEKDVQD